MAKKTYIEIISRQKWDSLPARYAELASLPHKAVLLTHTNCSRLACDDFDSCVINTQEIQIHHMDAERVDDIKYNFLICGDGLVYEGRGFLAKPTIDNNIQQKYPHLKDAFIVAIIGKMQFGQRPSAIVQETLQNMIQYGHKNGFFGSTDIPILEEWNIDSRS